jgi:hypothetical protein
MRKWIVPVAGLPALLLLGTCVPVSKETDTANWIATAPAGEAYTQSRRDSVTVLPNGRLLTPRGRQTTVAPIPTASC